MSSKSVFNTSKKFFIVTMVLLLSLQSFFITDLSKVEAAADNEVEDIVTSEEAAVREIEGTEASEVETMATSDSIGQLGDDVWITKSRNLVGRDIQGDLYIGPEAVVNIQRVNVTGDIYVLGALVIYGGLNTNGIYANSFSWGSTSAPFYGGSVKVNGGNSISVLNSSNRPLKKIPFKLYNEPIEAENGIIENIEGATIPIGDVAVEGKKVNLNSDGTFETGELNIGNKTSIKFTFKDVFGGTITKDYPVEVLDTIPPTVEINKKSAYFTETQEISLTISEPGNIYYTTDGSEPTDSSKVYKESIKIEDNTTLKYLAIDKAGNKSEVYSETYMFLSANELTDKDNQVTGKAYPGSTVKVVVGDKSYTGKAEADGTFKVDVDSLSDYLNVKVSATSESGVKSNAIEVNILDTTAPDQPTVNEVTDQSKVVKGEAEADSTVSVNIDGKEIGSGQANAGGKYSVSIPVQKAGSVLKITATDAAGNESEAADRTVIDVTAPEKPVVNPITDFTTEVSGTTEANAKIIVKNGEKVLGSTEANSKGDYFVEIAKQKINDSISVTATDKAGNVSDVTTMKVTEVQPPSKPQVDKVTDKSLKITGTGEAGSTIVIKSGKDEIGRTEVDKNGKFELKLKKTLKANTELTIFATNEYDKDSGKVTVEVSDVTPPAKPVVNEVGNLSTAITGKAEAGSNVEVKVNNKIIAKGKADKSGSFNIKINTQKVGTKLSITATDAAGNVSKSNNIEIYDSEVREKKVSKLGHIKGGASSVYVSPDVEAGKKSSEKYKDGVYYIKKQATYKGETFYLLSNDASATKGTIGWMKATDVSTHTHKGVDTNKKTLFVKGTKGSSYSRAWGGSKNEVNKDLTKLSNKKFIVNKTEKVGKNTWYRGKLDGKGKDMFIHSNYLYAQDKTYKESSVSLLGHIKSGKSDIYGSPANLSDKESTEKYKDSVYYVKKQAINKGIKYYLLSTEPSATKETIGWIEEKDISTHTHKSFSKKKKTLYIQGTEKAYDKAWGGSKDVTVKGLPKDQPTKFDVDLVEKVGKNMWYRGKVDGKTAWVHSSKVSDKKESKTSRLGHIRTEAVEIYKELGNSKTATKAGKDKTDQVYYIKKQAKVGKATHYQIATSPSNTKDVVGWVNAKDLSTHTHKRFSKKKQTLYIQGTDEVYGKAWGGSKDVTVKGLPKDQPTKFNVNLVEKVGKNIWYRGKVDGKTAWVHSSKVSDKKESKTSRLGHIRTEVVEIYKELGNSKTATKAGKDKTDQVYYIKKQAKVGKATHYQIATSPSSTKDVVGWVNAKDLSTHAHNSVDKKVKEFTIKGSGKSYSKAWGGEQEVVEKDLSTQKDKVFKVNLTETVGKNMWYRGKVDGSKNMWIHSAYVK